MIVSTSPLKLCDYKERCNQKADEDIIVGKNVRDFLAAAQFSSKERDEFHTSVREYYVAVCNYVISKFPLDDEVLLHARVANPNNRMEVTYSSLSFFVKRFKFMEEALDELEVEFAQFQIDKLENVSLDKRSDEAWVDIAGIRDKSTGQLKYVHLPKVMLAILSLPHSNADDERIFSLVRISSKPQYSDTLRLPYAENTKSVQKDIVPPDAVPRQSPSKLQKGSCSLQQAVNLVGLNCEAISCDYTIRIACVKVAKVPKGSRVVSRRKILISLAEY